MRLLVILLLFTACSDDKLPTYSAQEFLAMAKKGDPELKIITPKSMTHKVLDCEEYTPRCRYGYRVIVKKLQLAVLFYENPKDAIKAAKRIRGYLARNWVIDEVRGEPVLERWVVKHLKAEKAF